jgi:hypothetical protein
MMKIIPYANAEITGTIDWYNEAHVAYVEGEFARANVAAIMFHAESVEALRLLLLEGSATFGQVMAMGDAEVKDMEKKK